MSKKIFTGFVIASSAVYVFVLHYMLFRGFGRDAEMVMLSEDMRYNYMNSVNLVPFKTIVEYFKDLTVASMRGNAIRNLCGNFLLLFPLGFCLPFFIKKMSKLKIYIPITALFIIIIEVMQLITMTGSLDIDDFILNFAGALMGFLVFKYTPVRFLFKYRAY